jgi:hypothetical protein
VTPVINADFGTSSSFNYSFLKAALPTCKTGTFGNFAARRTCLSNALLLFACRDNRAITLSSLNRETSGEHSIRLTACREPSRIR